MIRWAKPIRRLRERHDYVKRVIRSEEESFGRTLDRGIEIFEDRSRQLAERGVTVFPGKDAFELHDTYGFPLDLTQLMAEEKQLTVDVKAFNREMDAQRQRSAQAAKNVNYQTIDVQAEPTQFLGYDKDETDASVIKYIDGKLVLSRTPFYAESGGQVGDIGVIKGDDFEFQVTDTQKAGEHVLHIGELKSGQPKPGDRATAVIDRDRRRATERNHTVTHLVHRALRMTLGEHVQQAGSLVGPETMRFDFTHFEALTAEQRHQVETIVNEQILKNRKTTWSYTDIETAKADGAVALFGEKYGDEVRVVEVENYSKELCGGTHVRATGEIGSFVIINESSVAAGIRRIECLTGMQALNYLENGRKVAQRSSRLLGCTPEQLESCVQALIDEQKEIQNELKTLRQQSSKGEIDTILDQIKQVNGIQVVAGEVHANEANDMRKLGDHVRNGLDSGVGVLGAAIDDKVSLVCVVTDDLVKKGVKAGDIIKKVASYVQGGGGGAPHMALAGGKDVSKLPLALSKVEQIVNECRN
ncbi:MAG: alanine--tRNA ligase [candidate division KSB1 bacterium]|nr:alanine--tRNA ligase [candidate division KSB1 bacterium]